MVFHMDEVGRYIIYSLKGWVTIASGLGCLVLTLIQKIRPSITESALTNKINSAYRNKPSLFHLAALWVIWLIISMSVSGYEQFHNNHTLEQQCTELNLQLQKTHTSTCEQQIIKDVPGTNINSGDSHNNQSTVTIAK